MGRKLSDGAGFAPTVVLSAKGEMFKGVLLGKTMRNFGTGEKPVYKFKAVDADCHFRQGKTEIDPPTEGAEVELVPSSRLAVQLAQATMGNMYTIVRLEDGKKGKFGNAPKLFDVEEN